MSPWEKRVDNRHPPQKESKERERESEGAPGGVRYLNSLIISLTIYVHTEFLASLYGVLAVWK
jgi:hypothetical protein